MRHPRRAALERKLKTVHARVNTSMLKEFWHLGFFLSLYEWRMQLDSTETCHTKKHNSGGVTEHLLKNSS